MSPKDNTQPEQSGVKPIEAPAGLDLHPHPPKAVKVSRRAGMAICALGLGLLAAFAYGGYRRQVRAQTAARQDGVPKSLAPATVAAKEFVEAIPDGDVPLASQPDHQLKPPGARAASIGPAVQTRTPPCGSDPATGQPYRFNPQTGQPCAANIVRQAPRVATPVPQQMTAQGEPTPQERLAAAAFQREQEARLAPTGIRSGAGGGSFAAFNGVNPIRTDNFSPIAALNQPLNARAGDGGLGNLLAGRGSASGNSGGEDYDAQNMQTRKEAFLSAARSEKTNDYLASTRSAPLGTYEIKAGWEIPAVLEQSLNSDLPGELKALVMQNVFDTATGRYLLIPQGARLIGKYDSRVSYGQDGVEVVWERIIYPDASSVDINGMVGLDSHGNAGLRDKVDRHYKRLFGFSALTSMFSAAFDLSQRRASGSGINGLAYPSVSDTASAAVGREMSQTGAMITRRNLNVQPTIKVPVGYKFTVRVNRDILFDAAYEPMQADPQPLMPDDRGLRRRSSAAVYDR